MKTAAIYCRVSTEEQGKEGTSLDSQREACVAKAKAESYEVLDKDVFIEKYSGLTLDRAELRKLRASIKTNPPGAIIAYTPDRLCRNGEDILTLAKEFKSLGVKLIFVKEEWEDTLNGKLIAFILGWASEFEASQIRERTMRGRRARAMAGRLPANSHAHLFGYTYIPGKGIGEGIRYVNEEQARWVREMFRWLVEEGLSSDAITYRLRDLGVPTPSGKGYWIRSSVLGILKNSSYCGKTYAFTRTYGRPKYRLKLDTKRENTGIIWRPKDEWVEIRTPLIIPEEVFNAAQERLALNRKMARRNRRNDYLLHGYVYCARCGRAFWGAPGIKLRNGKRYEYPYYQCSGRLRRVTPVKCENRQHNAKKLEHVVWTEVEAVLNNPNLILDELERREQEQTSNNWQKDLEIAVNQLNNRQKQKDRLWTAFRITGDEDTFRRDIAMLDREIQEIEANVARLKEYIENTTHLTFNFDNLKHACELVASNLKTISFEEKRLALQALQVKVLVDGENITIRGAVPLKSIGHIADSASRWHLLVPHYLKWN